MDAIHKPTGEKLKIVQMNEIVAVCELEKEIVITEKPYLATKIQICLLENLEITNPTI